MTDLNKLRSEFEAYEHSKKPCAIRERLFEVFTKDGLDEDEYSYIGKYVDSFMQEKWELWQKAKAQEVPEGYALVSKDKLHEWYCMANRSEELGCPECYESRGYAHNLACELNEASESGAEG